MAVEITQKLDASPDAGALPLETELALHARSSRASETVTVTYSINSRWNVAFETPHGHDHQVAQQETLSRTAREIARSVTLVRIDEGDPTDFVTITAIVKNKMTKHIVAFP